MEQPLERDADAGQAKRERLREIIAEKSLMTGRTFTLASGKTSSFFVNLKQTMLDPEGANLLADLVLEVMRAHALRGVGGLEMGAVPLVAAVCARSFPDYPVSAFFVRKKVKDHGAGQVIDGHLDPEAEVLIVDDVVTTGGSALQAAEAARARGATVTKVLAVVDREEGARENLAAAGLELISLFTRGDFPTIEA